MTRRASEDRNELGDVGVQGQIAVAIDPSQVPTQRWELVRAAQTIHRDGVSCKRKRPSDREERVREWQSDQPRQRQAGNLEVRFCVRAPVGIRHVHIRDAGDARADGERKPEIADDDVGSNSLEQRQVFADVSTQRLGREDGTSPSQRVKKGIARDRPEGILPELALLRRKRCGSDLSRPWGAG